MEQPNQANRYAHLINQSHNQNQNDGNQSHQASHGQQASLGLANAKTKRAIPTATATATTIRTTNGQTQTKIKPPAFGTNGTHRGTNETDNTYYYYNSFSTVDWREQWMIMKSKILKKVDEPQNQRKLIMVIVCCALLLDNMLYMVIVPIIPDYLRHIGAWSTYAKDAKWVMRRNQTGGPMRWERVSGEVVYEGEDSAVGFLFASKAIVQLFINPFSGAIIDRIGYELPMMIGLIVMFFSTMVFACGQTYSVLFLARSLQGVGSAFADTSGFAMIADRFTEENERQRALGVALAFISFGCLVAPPFGSVLYQVAGKEIPFIILSLICLIDGSLLLLVTPPGTFAQILPRYQPPTYSPPPQTESKTNHIAKHHSSMESSEVSEDPENGSAVKRPPIQRQKSISRRQSLTLASAGEAPKGTPIYVLFRDPYIACCAGALVVANVSLAFLEPTISIWMQNTMPEIEEWQIGMIWLPPFIPHVLGVYSTVKLTDKYPRYQWLVAAIGLILEGLSCLMVPFCSSFWSLIIPISIICFGVAQIDTAILPTLGYLVDTRYVSVYGSIYAIADISYSLSYAVGPIIAGGIVEAIGFTALNFLIAIITLGYAPALMMLRSIHDYEPFEADATGLRKKKEAPFGQIGMAPRSISTDEDGDIDLELSSSVGGQLGQTSAKHANDTSEGSQQQQQQQQQLKPALSKKGSIKSTASQPRKQHSVKIIESAPTDYESSIETNCDSKD